MLNNVRRSLLSCAAIKEYVEVVKMLLGWGDVKLHICDIGRQTLLIFTALYGYNKVIALLQHHQPVSQGVV